jgi:ribose transport system permease protein
MFDGRVASQVRPPFVKRSFETLALPVLILALASGVGFVEPRFLTLANLTSLTRQISPLLVLSIGQAFAVIGGGLDLSLASIMSLAGVVGVLSMPRLGMPAGVAVMLMTGTGCGLANGAMIAYIATTPLIVTLGMLSITQAVALILANGVPIYDVPAGLVGSVGFGTVGGVPVTVLIGLVTLLWGWWLLKQTVFGRYLYAIGSNRDAATKSGIHVRGYTMLSYGVSGLAAGVCAVVLTSWVGAARPIAEPTMTLQTLAAVVLGGVALTGGSGGVQHVVYGVLILSVLSNSMNMLSISAYYQTLTVGIVIILAVVLDRLRR